MMRAFLILSAMIALVVGATWVVRAHSENLVLVSGNPVATVWPAGATITYRINNQTAASLPNMEAGSDPVTAINNAFATNGAASGLTFAYGGTSSVTDVGTDGVNLVTFANTPANVGTVGGAVALTIFTYNTATAQILESDIVFNPATNFSTLGTASFQDVEQVGLHEIGHFVGQEHSAVCNATMYPFTGAGSTLLRTLADDDLSGLRTLYPGTSAANFGAVTGVVQRSLLNPVFGAHVVLSEASTGRVITAGVSSASGAFRIDSVPPGVYHAHVEPFDGPFQPNNLNGAVWNAALYDNTFRSMVIAGPSNPILVRAGMTRSIGTVTVAGPAPTLDLDRFAITSVPNAFSGFGAFPAGVTPPYTQFIVVGGPGVDTLPDSAFSIESTFVSISGPSTISGVLSGGGFKVFPVSVPANTPPGGYSVRVTSGGETAFMTGVFDVLPPATPQPWVGSYGQPCAGTQGPVVLSAIGAPSIGNAGFGFSVTGTVGGQTGFLVLSLRPDSSTLFTGCRLLVDINALLYPFPGIATPLSAGTTTLVTPIPMQANLAGLEVYCQFAAEDPLAPPVGLGISNGLLVHVE